jgi:hypothetical protein
MGGKVGMVGWWGLEDQGGVIVWKCCHEGYDAVMLKTSEGRFIAWRGGKGREEERDITAMKARQTCGR